MKYSALSSFSALFLLVGTLTLVGCGGIGSIPDTNLGSTSSAQPGAIQGSVFGGHAPIVGASVYVLQAGTGGYASASKSLITSTSSGASRDASGNYYVMSDANGKFNVTGDYTCTVNTPVYLAAIGGVTSDLIGGPGYSTSPLIITAGKVSSDHSTLTFTANNLLYPGQGVVFSFPVTSAWAVLNGGVYYVTNTITYPLTTTSFSIAAPSGTFTGPASGTATPQSSKNPAIANLAVLGNCPSSGNFTTGSAAIQFLYMNEVATTATAYALSGFGSGPFNIGYPGSSALAFTGIQNAANNAAQLYNIQGLYVSSSFAGEGHIANPVTPSGLGTVPQSTLDTIGNILASCVDSTNYGNSAINPDSSSNGAPSTSCSKLFTDATSNGIPYGTTGSGTVPTDIATAAFNIAHNPGSNLVSLFGLQGSETTPFAPNLSSAPNDFTIGINFLLDAAPQSIAVDASGNGWLTAVPSTGTGEIVEGSPLGVGLYQSPDATYEYGDIVIDSNGDAWTGNQNAYVPSTEITVPALALKQPDTADFTYAGAAVADGAGDVYFPHGPTNNAAKNNDQTLSEVNSAGTVNAGTTGNLSYPYYLLGVGGSFGPNEYVTHGAIDNTGAIWFTSTNGNVITRVNATSGTASLGFPFTQASIVSTCGVLNSLAFVAPEQVAIDASNNGWVPVNNGNAGTYVVKISAGGACSYYTVGTGPFGVAIDGAGSVWVTNSASNTLTELNSAGTVISPSTGYLASRTLNGPQELAVDLSGDLIIANYTGNSVVQVIGAAVPTYAPLGVAAANKKLGQQP